jgi:prepilin-type N-terminal cleavage/methylation domain-containing protein
MKKINKTKQGFTLVEIMIVVAIIGLLAAIAIPNFVKARTTAQKNACIANLKQIDGAKEQWAIEAKKTEGDAPDTTAINAFLKNSQAPTCPANGAAYTYNNVGTTPTCPNGATLSHTL